MKIAIISDIHNNNVNLKKVLNYCEENNIKQIICCGDLASLEMLDYMNDNFTGKILFTFGNMDDDFLRDYQFKNNQYKNTEIFKNFGEFEVSMGTKSPIGDLVPTKAFTVRIAFVHYPDVARELCETGKYKFVFYGHTQTV